MGKLKNGDCLECKEWLFMCKCESEYLRFSTDHVIFDHSHHHKEPDDNISSGNDKGK